MGEEAPVRYRPPRSLGLLLALTAALVLVLAWIYLIPLLDGTAAEELKYVIYAACSIGVLSTFHWLEQKLFPSDA